MRPRSFPDIRASIMVEELAAKLQPNEDDALETVSSIDMEMESSSSKIPDGSKPLVAKNRAEKLAEEGGGGGVKRKREEGNAMTEEEEDEGGASRKRMVERSLEERKRQFPHLIHRCLFSHLLPTLPTPALHLQLPGVRSER